MQERLGAAVLRLENPCPQLSPGAAALLSSFDFEMVFVACMTKHCADLCCWLLHHAVSDGICIQILVEQLSFILQIICRQHLASSVLQHRVPIICPCHLRTRLFKQLPGLQMQSGHWDPSCQSCSSQLRSIWNPQDGYLSSSSARAVGAERRLGI